MKIRTESQFCGCVDEDLIWRKKELTQIKFLLDSSRNRADQRAVLLRGAVTLLYAHWEGFIKTAGMAYLEYVASQRLRFDQLAPNFLALAARNIINSGIGARKIDIHLTITQFFLSGLGERCNLPYKDKDGITTGSNLSSEILREIVDTLGLDFSPYSMRTHLIDEALLKSRNTIAHGEFLEIDIGRYEELYREIIEMMEMFRTQIQNAVATQAFKAHL